MIEFSLSKSKRKALPEAVTVDGNAFSINPSFRTILKALRLISDEQILDAHKAGMLLRMFYGETIPDNVDEAIKAFQWFVRRGDNEEPKQDGKPPVFDYEQDASEVYSSFYTLYSIDLIESEMHWWKFSALLDGAFRSECPLSDKIKLRTIDPSKCENAKEVQEAQESIKIETNFTREEKRNRKRLEEVLTGGGDVVAALEALKHGK